MTHCAKCGTELIGSRKFCAACGAPAGDPRSPAASTGQAPATAGHMSGPAPGAVAAAPGSAPASAPGSAPGSGPSLQYAPPSAYGAAGPPSHVNPFAQTAGPGQQRPSNYGPPPSVPPELAGTTKGVGEPSTTPQVSPLAISNAASVRGAFQNAMAGGPLSSPPRPLDAAASPSASPPSPPVAADSSPTGVKRAAGTQIMPSTANPGLLQGGAPSGAPAPGSSAPKRQDRTQLLGVFPGIPPGGVPSVGVPSVGVPSGGVSSGGIPSGGVPSVSISSGDASSPFAATALPVPSNAPVQSQMPMPPPPAPPPPAPPMPAIPSMHVGAPMPPIQPPQPSVQPQPSGWNPGAYAATPQPLPPQPPPPYGGAPAYAPQAPPPPQPPPPPPMQPPGYVFGYAAGSRVHVTWSNGQRYPGTVQQVSGSQCLVVFPDGQHHWVEMQYVAPA